MQKTGWTNHFSFLVLSGLKKGFTLDVITRGQSTTIFLCIGLFSAWWQTNKQTYKRPTRWSQCKPALDQWEGSLLQLLLWKLFLSWSFLLLRPPAISASYDTEMPDAKAVSSYFTSSLVFLRPFFSSCLPFLWPQSSCHYQNHIVEGRHSRRIRLECCRGRDWGSYW